jgi:Arc/MetJ-type ribon-helix-helix transcriptional regulator
VEQEIAGSVQPTTPTCQLRGRQMRRSRYRWDDEFDGMVGVLQGVAMTIELKPEHEKLIQEKLRSGVFSSVEEVIHQALVSLATPEPVPERQPQRKNLVELFAESPLKGLDLNLERD